MKTFITIKKKINKYQTIIKDLSSAIELETNNLRNELYNYWRETKFLVAKKSGNSCYLYLSTIDPIDNDFFEGIIIDEKNIMSIGKISIKRILLMDEYEAISNERFFRKLRAIGIDLSKENAKIAEECNKFKPAKIEPFNGEGKIVGYCRLSCNSRVKNGYDRQISTINKFLLNKGGYSNPDFFCETISGTIAFKDRKAVKELLEFCLLNDIHEIIISELNRLGRTKNVIMTGISFLRKNGINKIHVIKENLLIDEDYISEHFRHLNLLAKSCEDEYNNILFRMKTGYSAFYEKYKNGEANIKIGRQNYKKSETSYASDYSKEIEMLNSGFSMRQIRTITGISLGTLQKIKKMFVEQKS